MCVEENRLETNTSGFRFHVDARDRFSRSACVSLQWKKTALLSPSPPVSRHGMRHSLAWCTPRHTTPRHAAPRHAAPRHATPLFLVAQLQNSRIIVTRAFPRFSGATGQQQPTCVRCIHNGRLAQEMESSRRSLEKETRQNGDRSRSSGVDGHVGDRERENAENDRALRCADEP